MPISNRGLRKATTNPRVYLGGHFALPIIGLTTIVVTLVLIYLCCRTVSLSHFMITRALSDPTSRSIAIIGFALFGFLLVACEARIGTNYSRLLALALAVFLEAIAVDNYGTSHVVWTFGYFIVGSLYVATSVRFAKLALVYFAIVSGFLVVWLLRADHFIVSIMQLSTVGMLILVIAVRVFDAYAAQLRVPCQQALDASS